MGVGVIPRWLLFSLVATGCVLLVALAVVAAVYAIMVAAQDAGGARVLGWAAVTLLLLLLTDLTLLVGALALRELEREE